MKKALPFFIFCCISSFCFAQSQRTILIEEFTQASCGSCNYENTVLQGLINANNGKIVCVKYQTDWPGYDPMNLDNPSDANTRRWYYAPSGDPHAYMDSYTYGASGGGFPSEISQTDVDTRYAVPSPFTIKINSHISPNWDSIYVTAVYKASEAVTGNMKAHVVVIERHIHFSSPPGSNGETDFYDVMKKLLPVDTGFLMPDSMALNDSIVINTSWKLGHIYDLSQLGVVCFVQNDTTKEVLQAGFDSTKLVANSVYDALPLSISYPGALYCGDSVAPVVTIRNQGSSSLSSVDIHYQINSGAVNTYHWTGSLGFFASAVVNLPKVPFTNLFSNNQLLVVTSQPDNNTDQLVANDTARLTFSTRIATNPVYFEFKVGYAGFEDSWTLKNSSGTIIDQGGNYPNNTDSVDRRYWHLQPDCYILRMNDAEADGINGGYYFLQDSTQQYLTLTNTGQFHGSYEETAFEVSSGATGIETINKGGAMMLYPNPSEGNFTIQLGSSYATAQIAVYDMVGQLVLQKNISNSAETTINLDGGKTGIYLVKVVTEKGIRVSKLVVE